MRKGQNPAKLGIPSYQPQRLGVAVLTYIPSLEGYFEETLSILKVQIASLRRATPQDFDLFLFDNGSCPAARQELYALFERGWVDWLFVSQQNLGKTGALNWILGAMPNEYIVYADSDVLFRAGWLEASLKILEAFPEAGMVSAQPCFFDVLHGEGQAHQRFQEAPGYRVEARVLPEEVVEEYCRGIGATPERAEAFRTTPVSVLSRADVGVEAVIGATHMQFLIPRDFARQLIPLPATRGLATEEDRILDLWVDQAGRLHLSTLDAWVYHMGNRLDERLLAEAGEWMDALALPDRHKAEARLADRRWLRLLKRLSRFRPLQNLLRRIYNLLFEYYAQS